MTTIVYDASADVIRLGDNALGRAARECFADLQERHDVVAPALFAWEVGNALHGARSARFGRTTRTRAQTLAYLLESIELLSATAASLERTGVLAERHRLTFYDAAYVEAASAMRGARLVTEDGALLAAGRLHLGPGRALSTMELRDALASDDL